MEKDRIALLDTDFISKAYHCCPSTIRLIDLVLSLPEYTFYCHQQIVVEMARHFSDTEQWLSGKIQAGEILGYTDDQILSILQSVYGLGCYPMYTTYLKEACNAFGTSHFSTHYGSLSSFDYNTQDKTTFLAEIAKGDTSVGIDNHLGEIKTYVLLQILANLNGEQIYMFYSDDGDARKGMIQFSGVSCFSVLSLFLQLKNENVLDKTQAQPYFTAYRSSLAPSQTQFRVMKADREGRIDRVLCEQVFEDIFDDKFEMLRNGMLRYKK